MGEDDSGGVMFQGGFDNFAWVDTASVDGAAKEFFVLDDAMSIVQEQAGEDFVRFVGELEFDVVFRVFGTAKDGFIDVVVDAAFENGEGGLDDLFFVLAF